MRGQRCSGGSPSLSSGTVVVVGNGLVTSGGPLRRFARNVLREQDVFARQVDGVHGGRWRLFGNSVALSLHPLNRGSRFTEQKRWPHPLHTPRTHTREMKYKYASSEVVLAVVPLLGGGVGDVSSLPRVRGRRKGSDPRKTNNTEFREGLQRVFLASPSTCGVCGARVR